ncbi:MAG: response regulator [Euryarchaeota archaeon]|nr:response regulator [Euryarchaeota archaeon]
MQPKILVVDDEELIRLSLRKLLEKHGYPVEVASSASEALEKLKADGFRIVITDIMMPDMDGIELLRKIKEQDRGIYVIMITAYASLERAIASLKFGASDFIQKPYENREIIEAVKKAVETLEEESRGPELAVSVKPAVIDAFRRTCHESVAELAEAVRKITGIDTSIKIEGPVVEEIENFPNLVGGEGIAMVGSYASLYGALSGSATLLFPIEDAIRFIELLSDKKVDYADFPNPDDREVLKEVGSIISEDHTRRLRELAGIDVKITPASFVDLVSGNFVSFLELRTGRKRQYYFAHKLLFQIGGAKQILGYLLLIFDLRNIGVLNSRFQ